VGIACQIHPRLSDQGPGPERLMLLNLPNLDRQGNLGRGIDQQQHFPPVDRHLDLVHPPLLVLNAHLPGDLPTPAIAGRGLQIGAIRNPGDLLAEDPGPGQGLNRPIEQALQVPQVRLLDVVGQHLRADWPRRPLALPLGGPPTGRCPGGPAGH
jgi:hypothetical protein